MCYLNIETINKFADKFFNISIEKRIDKYLEKESGEYQANIIHSGIIWSREIVECFNRHEYGNVKKISTGDLLLLFSYVDILLEATEQIYRVLYKTREYMKIESECIFSNKPAQYMNCSDREYFKEIRAIFGAHPVNLRDPQLDKRYRFADIPYKRNRMLINYPPIQGNFDFYIKIWTPTYEDEDTIYVPLIVDEVIMFAKVLVERFNIFSEKIDSLSETLK